MATPLITNATGDLIGSSIVTVPNGYRDPSAFTLTCFIWAATWDVAAVVIQVSPDNVKWFDVDSTITSIDLAVNIFVGGGVHVRAVVSGGGSPAGLNVYISD